MLKSAVYELFCRFLLVSVAGGQSLLSESSSSA
jgi:hypothetical protein